MDFDRRFAVFQRVALRNRIKRQLALFADGDEADVQLIRQRRADDEAACIQACHDIDFLTHIAVNQQVHQKAEIFRALKHRRNVVK